ncbi:MAG TPA: FtsX-like permease family protein, partial [Cytophagales bacterium]
KTTALRTQPLTSIHLRSNLGVELAPNGDIRYVYLLAAIGAFVLLIAGVNFVNLATARSARRAAEIGIRKANGASQPSLVRQFLLESSLVSLLAATGALALCWLLPFFNAFTGKTLSWGALPLGWLLPGLLGAALGIGVLAGLYPAAFLASFRPQQVLKGGFRPQGNVRFRRVLVVGQFVIAVLLLVGTGVISNQLAHLRSARLGFDQEQVLLIPINRSALTTLRGYERFKETLLQHPQIRHVTAAEQVLGVDFNAGSYRPEGAAEPVLFSRMTVQHDFVETFRIPLAAGRSFSKQFASDTSQAVMVNEVLVKHLGWESPRAAIGKRFDVGPFPARIIGVMKDFRTASLHRPVEPFVLQMPRSDAAMEFFIKYLAVRIGPGNPAPALAYVQKQWNAQVPDKAFEFAFLDERLDGQYRLEENTARVVGAFTGVAIFLACLGLLGLISFTAERRTKEIGIRKVLGAPVRAVAFLLMKEFVGLVLVANAIALPLAWWLLGHWLSRFTEKAPLPYSAAGVAVGVTVAVTLLTTGYHALQAAHQNPVKALRTD